MAFLDSGTTKIHATLVQTAGTPDEVTSWLASSLSSAGWSFIENATPVYRMRSRTSPSGHVMRLKIASSGGWIQVRGLARDESTETSDVFNLFPGFDRHWRLLANGFQFFLHGGRSFLGGSFFACGVPSPEAGIRRNSSLAWMCGDSMNSQAKSQAAMSFAKEFRNMDTGGSLVQMPEWFRADLRISPPAVSGFGDDSFAALPLLAARVSAQATSRNYDFKAIGYLWDSILVSCPLPIGVELTWRGRKFRNITHFNLGEWHSPGSLCVLLP